jgi:hypothetical protein
MINIIGLTSIYTYHDKNDLKDQIMNNLLEYKKK